VRLLYPPGYERSADRTEAALAFALPRASALYGAYPYPTLTVVHPPERAGEAGGDVRPPMTVSATSVHEHQTSAPRLTPRGVVHRRAPDRDEMIGVRNSERAPEPVGRVRMQRHVVHRGALLVWAWDAAVTPSRTRHENDIAGTRFGGTCA
jgi:hypothetical protein